MKKLKQTVFIHIFFLFFVTVSYAQNQDSIAFSKAKFETKKLAPGVRWKHCHFNNRDLFNSNQNINILEVKLKKRNQFLIGYEKKALKPTSEFAKESGAIAAINGTFFNMKNGGSVDYIRSAGQVIAVNRLSANGERDIKHQRAAIVIQKGKIAIEKWDGTSDWEDKLIGEDVMVTGPLIYLDGKQEILDSIPFVLTRHPRTAVVLTDKNRVLLITIDGRQANSAGVSLFELSKIMKWLKVKDGINLDGGGSTTFWLKNYSDNGVVNYPTDNKKWDHQGERKVANVLLLKIKDK